MLRRFVFCLLLAQPMLAMALSASPDPSFGQGGWAEIDLADEGDRFDELHTLGLAANGDYLGLASTNVDPVTRQSYIVRLDPRGQLLAAQLTGIPQISVQVSTVLPGGTGVLIAYTAVLSDERRGVRLQRWRGDGTLDSAFGVQGTVLLEQPDLWLAAGALFVRNDGGIVVGGRTADAADPFAPTNDSFVAAFRADGMPDSAFGDAGFKRTSLTASGYEDVQALHRDGDGRLFLCGTAIADGSADALIARLDATGALDPAFGTLGVVRHDTSGNGVTFSEFCTAITRHPGTQRMQVAVMRNNGVGQPGTVRVFSVSSSGGMGTWVDAISGATRVQRANLVVDDSGRLVVSAVTDQANGDYGLSVGRVTSTLQPDTSFTPDGARRYMLVDVDAGVNRELQQAPALFVDRGRIVTAANAGVAGIDDTRWAVLRLQGDAMFEDGFESP